MLHAYVIVYCRVLFKSVFSMINMVYALCRKNTEHYINRYNYKTYSRFYFNQSRNLYLYLFIFTKALIGSQSKWIALHFNVRHTDCIPKTVVACALC